MEQRSSGGNYPAITQEELSKINIPIPPKEIQAEIVAKMDAAYATKKQKEAEAQLLLDSIDDYLLGELGIELPKHKINAIQSRMFTRNLSEVSSGRFDPIFYCSIINKFNSGKYESLKIQSIAKKLVSGVGVGKQGQSTENEGIIQIRPTNISKDGILKYDKNIFLPKSFQGPKIKVDDILFNNTNSQSLVGKTSILKEKRELFFSNHITKIEVDRDKIIPDYLSIVLNLYQRNKIFYSICTNWNNQSGIGLDLLSSLKIPIPPKEIQAKIVAKMHAVRQRVKQLREEAKKEVAQAKKEVEMMIIGEFPNQEYQ